MQQVLYCVLLLLILITAYEISILIIPIFIWETWDIEKLLTFQGHIAWKGRGKIQSQKILNSEPIFLTIVVQ